MHAKGRQVFSLAGEGPGLSGIGARGVCDLPSVGVGNRPLEEQKVFLTMERSLQCLGILGPI